MRVIVFAILVFFSQLALSVNMKELAQLRETCSCPGCDLTKANLPNFKLGDKQTLNVTKAKRDQNGLIICDLSHANFTGANLKNAYFSPSDFAPGINEKVSKVLLVGANFSGAHLPNSHWNAVVADGANFKGANLKAARMMKSASFKSCLFTRANLTKISVSPPMGGCGADFSNSDFSQANLSNSQINANFNGANFFQANLLNSVLKPCDMSLENAFSGTQFVGANLTNVKLDDKPLNENMLPKAKLCKTKLPGKVSNRDC